MLLDVSVFLVATTSARRGVGGRGGAHFIEKISAEIAKISNNYNVWDSNDCQPKCVFVSR